MKEHELVLRLRKECSEWGLCGCYSNVNHNALVAEELMRLKEENGRLREAVRAIKTIGESHAMRRDLSDQDG